MIHLIINAKANCATTKDYYNLRQAVNRLELGYNELKKWIVYKGK